MSLLLASACAAPDGPPAEAVPLPGAPQVWTAPPPSEREPYCAWYGAAREGVLYFGEAAFWGATRAAGGDPTADLREPGPQLVGRFDIANAAPLPPLHVFGLLGEADRSGVWDVLAWPDGRLYFTTYFEAAGVVETSSGLADRFENLGVGLNELAPGPDGTILASRYGGANGENGSVLWFTPEGALVAEHRLAGGADEVVAAKSVAFDPRRRQIWVNTDVLPKNGGPVGHDARVLDLEGRELARIEDPEIQFFVFDADGTGLRVERIGRRLLLRVIPAGASSAVSSSGRTMLLDDAFHAESDFAQDLTRGDDGRVVVTRWSGRVHVIELAGGGPARAWTLALPRHADGSLYYTGVIAAGRLCATECAGVTVTCIDAPR